MATKVICGKRSRFLCTLEKGHAGQHGRQYRRDIAAEKSVAAPAPAVVVVATRVDHDGGPRLTSDLILLERGTFNRYKIGGVPAGQSGRKVDQGPLVPGPWHYVFGLSTCIAADPEQGTYGEMKRARAAGLVVEVSAGDVLVIDGLTYKLVRSGNGVLVIE